MTEAGDVRIGPPEPGELGWLIAGHGAWYSENTELGVEFEVKVATIAAGLAARLAPPRVTMLFARDAAGPLATLSADADDPDAAGRGRIRLVYTDPRARGRGLGGRLLREALDGLRAAGVSGAYLDTLAGLDAARRLYERFGFTLAGEVVDESWGPRLVEQRFDLDF